MKKIKLLAIALISALSLNSCLVDDEVASQNLAESGYTVGFSRDSFSYAISPGAENIEESIHIDLLGGNGGLYASSDIVVSATVNTDLSSADEGTHFLITNAINEFTIPAGESFATESFEIEILTDAVNIGDELTLVIDLTVVNGGNVVTNQLVMDIAKCDPPLAGTFTVANFFDPADPTWTVPNGSTNIITPKGCNDTYRINRLEGFSTDYWFDIEHDVTTNAITITDFEFQSSNPLTGSGTYNPATNTISFNNLSVAGVPWYVNFDYDLVGN